jgi:hypothetical protein
MVAHTTGQTTQNIIEYLSKENRKGDQRAITKQAIRRAEQIWDGNDGHHAAIGHRYDLPLVLADDDGVAPFPAGGLPFELSRGFFGTLASPPSLITIFAWISSSLPALTFFGQNNVTNLRPCNVKNTELIRDRARLRTSKGVFATCPGPPLPLSCCRVLSLFGARWQRETPSGLQPCHRGACHRQTTSVVSASRLNRQDDAVEGGLTSCFLTGRSSSLVAASSIDGLPEQRYFECQ